MLVYWKQESVPPCVLDISDEEKIKGAGGGGGEHTRKHDKVKRGSKYTEEN